MKNKTRVQIDQVGAVYHSFEFQGFAIELDVRTDFTAPEYDRVMKEIEAKTGTDSLRTLAEIAAFLVSDWNLADKDGDIPLVVDEVYQRVQLMLLTNIVKEAQNLINTGGLTKNAEG